MIVIPAIKPQLLKQHEVDFGTTASENLVKRVVEFLNFVEKSLPIGIIIFVYQSMTDSNGNQIPLPSSNWKFCDGSLVTNTQSPLFNQHVPDLRGRYLKMSATNQPIGTLGGNSSVNLTHNHGGWVWHFTDLEGNWDTDNGSAMPQGDSHTHQIYNDLGIYQLNPQHIVLQPYMRIL
jgi:hypothetical protein